uniref:Uncharacterized protein n=1 Tax=Anguilla anguilla TaxID=7936 RepID=A0A0E9S2T0_ANGAN
MTLLLGSGSPTELVYIEILTCSFIYISPHHRPSHNNTELTDSFQSKLSGFMLSVVLWY